MEGNFCTWQKNKSKCRDRPTITITTASGLTALFRLLIFRKQRSKRKKEGFAGQLLVALKRVSSFKAGIHVIAATEKVKRSSRLFSIWCLRSVCDRRDRTTLILDRNYNWSISTWSQQSLNFFWSDRGNHIWKRLSGLFRLFRFTFRDIQANFYKHLRYYSSANLFI